VTAFPRNPELEAALVEDPDDDGLHAVYGDWLQQAGSPHGELIQIQRALVAEPRSVPLRRRESQLLDQHGAALVGASLVERIHLLGWHAGFVQSAELWRAQLLELSGRPAGLLLRALEVHGEWTLQPAIDRLAEAMPPLRALLLGISSNDPDLSHAIGDLGRLWRALPRLARLTAQGGAVVLGELATSSLRELMLRPTELTVENLRSISEASLPALTHLELWFEHGEESNGGWSDWWQRHAPRSVIRLDAVRRLLASTQLPALRHLVIANTTLGDGLCEAIASSPLAAQLHSLALPRCTITDAGAAMLARHRAAFRQLERIDLDGNRIATAELLQGLPRDGKWWSQYPTGLGRRSL
jgi:uncharacterized protein (TIGR02996 family)